SLGSNIEPERNLARAVDLLRERTNVLAVSSAYQTAPQGFTEQADFLNMAVALTTTLDAVGLKREVLDAIERELKRVRDPNNKNAPRTIDLDISLWGSAVFEYGAKPYRIPDADIVRFAHVAVPLAELAPELVHPSDGRTLREIADSLSAIS
ncbi:MAG: 2-amino-4-hydroxy-6-hydroxymethyldihydropteridine diphosphokinase, partial [Burkholderiales bacterium]|nr:2-amino-4-hydroxy-6-hydroxymethyldihydropteridine diphosphokinase [Anaerolineae bacterium]